MEKTTGKRIAAGHRNGARDLKVITTRPGAEAAKIITACLREWCRQMPKAMPAEAPYYVYGDRVAIIKMTDPVRVVFIKNPTLAESFRAQFEYHWEISKRL